MPNDDSTDRITSVATTARAKARISGSSRRKPAGGGAGRRQPRLGDLAVEPAFEETASRHSPAPSTTPPWNTIRAKAAPAPSPSAGSTPQTARISHSAARTRTTRTARRRPRPAGGGPVLPPLGPPALGLRGRGAARQAAVEDAGRGREQEHHQQAETRLRCHALHPGQLRAAPQRPDRGEGQRHRRRGRGPPRPDTAAGRSGIGQRSADQPSTAPGQGRSRPASPPG